jgi:alkylation response protein AidB-like acyl-CoA dehydrogenase
LSCLGFSEPGAGSDVFGARTRAVRDGDDWIVNGQKMFTTGAHISDYVLLLTRTNPDAGKRDGLTLFLMPLNLPGVAIQAVHTLMDERTNITFYEDVRVPDRYRLGEVDRGIEVMAAALLLEHGGEGYHVSQLTMMRDAIHWALAPGADGEAPIAREPVRAKMAEVATHTEIADLLCRRASWAASEGVPGRAFGPMSKLFSTDTYLRDSADLLELAAPDSLLIGTNPAGKIELAHRHALGPTIYGGTSEVHRSIIAEQALGMPRTRN